MSTEKPKLKYELARRYRKALTAPEARLWLRLKNKPEGVHFRKQHPIGPYIVDFYCAGAKLVVEVEGLVHDVLNIAEKDEPRNLWLEAQGLELLRIPASEIMRDPDEVALGVLIRAMEIMKAGRLPLRRDKPATSP